MAISADRRQGKGVVTNSASLPGLCIRSRRSCKHRGLGRRVRRPSFHQQEAAGAVLLCSWLLSSSLALVQGRSRRSLRMLSARLWNSKMLDKRLHGCLLLLIFLLANASGSNAVTLTVDPERAVAPAAIDSDDGRRRSLAGAVTFCVAKQGADPAELQVGLNWACGPGHANCAPIQPGGSCYKQNDLPALASYAYNDYYQRNANTGATCDFNGTATTTPADPSSGQCVFTGSSMAGGSTLTPAANAPSGLSPPSSFTPGFGNGSSSFGPTGLIPLDGAESLQSGARWAICALMLALPLFFLL